MNDSKLTFRQATATSTVDHLGVVTANAATAVMDHNLFTGNWFDMADYAGIPFGGMDLLINYIATGFTSTGATGTASVVWQIDFADTATVGTTTGTVVYTITGRAIVATFATSASLGFALDSVTYDQSVAARMYKLPLPQVNHRYARLKATTTLGTITGAAFGAVGAALEPKSQTTTVVSIG